MEQVKHRCSVIRLGYVIASSADLTQRGMAYIRMTINFVFCKYVGINGGGLFHGKTSPLPCRTEENHAIFQSEQPVLGQFSNRLPPE
jgi:hypothetical protein